MHYTHISSHQCVPCACFSSTLPSFPASWVSEEKWVPLCPFGPLKPKLSEDLWSHPKSCGCHKTALLPLIQPQTFPDPISSCTFSKLPLEDIRLCCIHAPEVHTPFLTQWPQQQQRPHWEDIESETCNNCVCLSVHLHVCHHNENKPFYLIWAALNCDCTLTHLCRFEPGSQVHP